MQLIDRVGLAKVPALLLSLSSLVELSLLAAIAWIFEQIVSNQPLLGFEGLILLGSIVVFSRSILVYFLRKKAFESLVATKNEVESNILTVFLAKRRYVLPADEDTYLSGFKERVTNSSMLASINFDLPVAYLLGEVVFALGGILGLVYHIGWAMIFSVIPLMVILALVMRKVASSLKQVGQDVLDSTERRLSMIDNVVDGSLELSMRKDATEVQNYFNAYNSKVNHLMSRQLTLSSVSSLLVESASVFVILIALYSITTGSSEVTGAGIAASLAILSRLVPTITRSLASFTQLHYGIPAVIRLAKLNEIAEKQL